MYDSAVIFSGWDVAYFMMIPPKQKEWKITGYCPSACTKKVSLLDKFNVLIMSASKTRTTKKTNKQANKEKQPLLKEK